MVLWLGQGERAGGYPLLARLLAAEYGLPALPEMARAAQGKPFFPDQPHLHFNVSHSGGLLLCGAGETELGVDVERVHPRRAELCRYVLSDLEYDWYVRRGSRWGDFYTLWVLKESRVKCEGGGLRRPARAISVPLPESDGAVMWEGFAFRTYAGTDWRAAVCTRGSVTLPNIFLFS